jgi:preprotein translocase subunit SecA
MSTNIDQIAQASGQDKGAGAALPDRARDAWPTNGKAAAGVATALEAAIERAESGGKAQPSSANASPRSGGQPTAQAQRPAPNSHARHGAKGQLAGKHQQPNQQRPAQQGQAARSPVATSTTSATAKLGRNDPCYCGSGKKYKLCHGR